MKTRRRNKEGGDAQKGAAIEGTSAYCIFNCEENLSLEIIQFDGTRTYCVFDSREKFKEALLRGLAPDRGRVDGTEAAFEGLGR